LVDRTLLDVTTALDYDPDQIDARNTLARLLGISTKRGRPLQEGMSFQIGENDGRRIVELAAKYKIAPE
jgi:hypothetical protein